MSDHDQRRLTLAMSGRDLMTIGIFAAIYLVLYYGITMFGFLNPVMMIATLGLSVVVGAIPFMLFLARVKHAGMVFLFTLIVALVCLVLGFPPVAVVLLIALSVVIEVIQAVTGYRSRWAGVISYIVFAMWYAGPLLPLYYDRAGYFSSMVANGRGEAYVHRLDGFLSTGVLVGYDVGVVVLGLVGGVIALILLRKNFERAGLA